MAAHPGLKVLGRQARRIHAHVAAHVGHRVLEQAAVDDTPRHVGGTLHGWRGQRAVHVHLWGAFHISVLNKLRSYVVGGPLLLSTAGAADQSFSGSPTFDASFIFWYLNSSASQFSSYSTGKLRCTQKI